MKENKILKMDDLISKILNEINEIKLFTQLLLWKNKVINIDCLEGLKYLPNECADIVICDPPYNIGKNFGNESDKRSQDEYLNWCEQWLTECLRILKTTGTMYIYGLSETLSFIRVKLNDKINVRWLIWHYTNKNTPSLNFWQRSHESILCCFKSKKLVIFNKDEVREPYTEKFLNGSIGKIRKATKGRFSNGTKETYYQAHNMGALPRDVIKIPALAGGAGKKERVNHPTQKPLALCEILLKASKNKKDNLVVIPFAGSGSECISAKKLNMNFIGFEINEEYIKLFNQRLIS